MSEHFSDQRQDERKTVSWVVVGKWKSGKVFQSVTENVSRSGMMIISAAPSKVGERAYVKVKAMFDGKLRWVEAVIEVRHQFLSGDVYKMGVKFIKIGDENRQFIQTQLDRLAYRRSRNSGACALSRIRHASEQEV